MAGVFSVIESGFEGTAVEIECHLSNNLPTIVIVGFGNRSVDEAKERIRGAFSASGIKLPRKRITINLAPADIPKDGSGLDLAIAVAIMRAGQLVPATASSNMAIFGELGLDGDVRPLRGIIGLCLAAQKHGFTELVIPERNLRQASLIPGLKLLPVSTLDGLFRHLSGTEVIPGVETGAGSYDLPVASPYMADFSEVVGQHAAKRALEIAAAGSHNVLLSGPPGTGKSMLAKAMVSILPKLTRDEALTVTHLHSLAARTYDRIIYDRPFRSPHHSASDASIVGGGQRPRPGEISLAHSGVLFLDELPEFRRSTIEVLRQPLEDRVITVSRARESVSFPAEFILVATRNPCPCGYYGSDRQCICSLGEINRYDKKLSGPILDRIDLYVDVEAVDHAKLLRTDDSEDLSATISRRVENARQRQYGRPLNGGKLNGNLDGRTLKKAACLTEEAKSLLDHASARLRISARAYMRTVRVARTIADLEGSVHITAAHVAEALQYRPKLSALESAPVPV